MGEINNTTVIKNISYDQSEILYNIMQLYNNGKPFDCDITASELKFYGKDKKTKYEIPVPKILMDVYPQNDETIKIIPFRNLPLEDNSIESIVVDLPFVISPKDCPSKTTNIKEGSNLISKRFSSFYPADELFENIYWWLKECYRVLKEDGIVIWKFQSTVSGGRELWSVPFSFFAAERIGFYVEDEFILEAKARIVANSHFKNGQKHSRKYTSTFWVFRKNYRLAMKNNCFRWLDLCEMQNLEGKIWDRNDKNNELNKLLDEKYNTHKIVRKKPVRKRKVESEIIETVKIGPLITKTIEIEQEKKHKRNFSILQYDLNGNLIKEWNSYDEIVKEINISKASLSQCVHGKIKKSGGYVWVKKICD